MNRSAEPSILIVGYRAYDELAGCLASLAIHEPGTRIVLVDHEADEPRGRALTSRYPSVAYIPRSDNPGFAAGVNRAAEAAGSGPLILINPDCVVGAPVVQPLVELLSHHPDVGIVGGIVLEPDGQVQASARRFPDLSTAFGGRTSWLTRVVPENPLTRRNLQAPPSEGTPVDVDWVNGAFMAIRRETFNALGGFDAGFFLYWEDADFCRRAAERGWRTLYAPVAGITHLTSRTSRHARWRSLLAFHRSAFRYYWKHGGWLARALSPIVAVGLGARFLVRGFRSLTADD